MKDQRIKNVQHNRLLLVPALLLVFVLWLTGCTSLERETAREETPGEAMPAEEDSREASHDLDLTEAEAREQERILIEELVQAMTLEEKAGQVFMLAFRRDAAGEPLWRVNEAVSRQMNELQPGGIILFRENIDNEHQVRAIIGDFQSLSPIPLLMAVDEEGGRVSRLTHGSLDFPRIPAARAVGQTGDEQAAEETGRQLGEALKDLGFNMNMAPVADVDSNPRNPVIGDRSYGSDPNLAASMAAAVARGMMGEGVIPVYKHFPGHGDTDQDTHTGPVTLSHDQARLNSLELVPFVRGIDEGIPAIMTAHLLVPAYDDQLPATLSPQILTKLLRNQLDFQGIIITDALDMTAISQQWSSGEAAVKALAAGADVLLMPSDAAEAHQAVVTAVKEGTLSPDRLNEAVSRILQLKARYGMTLVEEPS